MCTTLIVLICVVCRPCCHFRGQGVGLVLYCFLLATSGTGLTTKSAYKIFIWKEGVLQAIRPSGTSRKIMFPSQNRDRSFIHGISCIWPRPPRPSPSCILVTPELRPSRKVFSICPREIAIRLDLSSSHRHHHHHHLRPLMMRIVGS